MSEVTFGSEHVSTIGSEVRRLFFRIMLGEITELQDRADVLKKAELYDSELTAHLETAFEELSAARVRLDELLGGDGS